MIDISRKAIANEPIANGVNFTSIQDKRFKQNLISVNFIAPLKKETAAANALLPLVLKRGCEGYPDMTELNRKLKELYGARLDGGVTKRGEIQIISLFVEMLDNDYTLQNENVLSECAELLRSVVFNPVLQSGAFLQENVDIEKRNLTDMINAQINDKRTYASRRVKEEMCKNEAYGINELGTIEDVSNITPQSLAEAWNTLLQSTAAEVFLIGPADPADCIKLFTDAFSKVQRNNILSYETKVIRNVENVNTIVERVPVNQAKLVMGFRAGVATPDSDVAAMQLATTVFGGSPNAKLFVNVREKMSLCYYCYSRYERQKGLMFVESGIEENNYEKAKDEILRQLEEVKSGNFSDDELKFAALSLENSYKEIADSLGDLNGWYLGQLLSGSLRSPSEAAEEVILLGRKAVIGAANKIKLDTVYLLAGTAKEENADAE